MSDNVRSGDFTLAVWKSNTLNMCAGYKKDRITSLKEHRKQHASVYVELLNEMSRRQKK